jgi:hypothetical protein
MSSLVPATRRGFTARCRACSTPRGGRPCPPARQDAAAAARRPPTPGRPCPRGNGASGCCGFPRPGSTGRPQAQRPGQRQRIGQRQAGHGTTARRAPGIALDSTPMRLPGASAVTAEPRRTADQKITKRYACVLCPVFKQALRQHPSFRQRVALIEWPAGARGGRGALRRRRGLRGGPVHSGKFPLGGTEVAGLHMRERWARQQRCATGRDPGRTRGWPDYRAQEGSGCAIRARLRAWRETLNRKCVVSAT